MKPLAPWEIRDLNREINERLASLTTLKTLAVVKSFKKAKCYGIGLSDPKNDLILRNLVRLMGGIYRPAPAAAATTSVTLYDTGNAARTVMVVYLGTSAALFNQNNAAAPGLMGSVLGFGNPATPPTPGRTDYELASLVSTIIPSSTTTDETNWRVIVTGSYVWAAGGTVREAGQYGKWNDTGNVWRLYLIYHDAVSDIVVPAGGTVSVTYTTQF